MQVNEVLEKIRDFLADDNQIKAWCQAQYNKDQTVWLGTNINMPPDSYSMPAIVIDSVFERSQFGTRSSFKVLIGLLLNDDRKNSQLGKVTFLGFLNCEKFREEVQKSILRAQKTLKAKIEFSDGGTFTNAVFPIWSGKMAVYVEYLVPANRIADAI